MYLIDLNKGDFLLENNNYEEAYTYYTYATTIEDNNSSRIENCQWEWIIKEHYICSTIHFEAPVFSSI